MERAQLDDRPAKAPSVLTLGSIGAHSFEARIALVT
jgi:hypothetical protein